MVVTVFGRLDNTYAQKMDEALKYGCFVSPPSTNGRVILDLSQVEHIAHTGWRMLLLFARNLRNRGKDLILCGLNAESNTFLVNSELQDVLKIEDNRAAALAVILA